MNEWLDTIQHLLVESELMESIQIFLIIIGSFLSEDIIIVSTALLAAAGDLPWEVFFLGNFLGLTIGDTLLYAAGRGLVRHPKIKRAKTLKAFQKYLAQHPGIGFALITIARFIPGTRFPVYISAGVGRYSIQLFLIATIVSVAVWVYLFYALSGHIFDILMMSSVSLWAITLGVIGLYLGLNWIGSTLPLLFDRYARGGLMKSWRKFLYYEFWPPQFFYLPVFFYYVYLTIKYGNPLLPSAVNPAIYTGGLIGESKSQIFNLMSKRSAHMLKYRLIDRKTSFRHKVSYVKAFIADEGLAYPVILKPDIGQRGNGVQVVRNDKELKKYMRHADYNVVVQEYCPYECEVGVFYIRHPQQEKGEIFSITNKQFPHIVGDGMSTIGELILADRRAQIISRTYLKRFEDRLDEVLAKGKKLRLVESGNHAQGAIFENGAHLETTALKKSIERLVDGMEGFYAGRFDLRFKDIKSLRQGRNFKIIEVNGAGSEATHIYDAKLSLADAYKILFKQWQMMFDIGAYNSRELGVPHTSFFDMVKALLGYFKNSRIYPIGS